MINCDKPTCVGCDWHDIDYGTCAKTESSPELYGEEKETIYFKNDNHKKLFLALKQKAGQGDDCEYTAALYVLSSLGKSVEKHVQPGEINFPSLFARSIAWSSSEKALIKLAAALFNAARSPAYIDEVFYSLDEENTRVALQGLEIRYLMR